MSKHLCDPLNLEELEQRIAPAGNVTAEVIGGFLFITGDAESNVIAIDQAGLLADQFRVTGEDGTTVGGGSSMEFLSAPKGIKLFMGDGSDSVSLEGATMSGSVFLNGGDGDNVFSADSTYISGQLVVKNGEGFQDIDLGGAVDGNLAITNGDGGSDAAIYANVGGNLVMKNGDGNDALDLGGRVEGNAVISNGMGDNSEEFTNGIVGNLTIKTLDGSQDLDLRYADVGGKMTVFHGAGSSYLYMSHVRIGGTLALTNGTGNHTAFIADTTEVGGAAKFTSGDGNNSLTLSAVTVQRGGSIRNGAGFDSLYLNSVLTASGAWSIRNGEGGSTTTMEGDSELHGAFTLANGDGDNAVNLGLSWIWGDVKIVNGDGNSKASIGEIDLGKGGPLGANFTYIEGDGTHDIDFAVIAVGKNTKIATGGVSDIDMTACFLDGSLLVKTGRSDDAISLMGAGGAFGRNVTIDSGAGNDQVFWDDISVGGNTTFRTGGGNDTLSMETQGDPAGSRSAFTGKVNILMGDGDDIVVVGQNGNIGHAADFLSAVAVDGGAGSDTLNVGNQNTFAVELVERSFEVVSLP